MELYFHTKNQENLLNGYWENDKRSILVLLNGPPLLQLWVKNSFQSKAVHSNKNHSLSYKKLEKYKEQILRKTIIIFCWVHIAACVPLLGNLGFSFCLNTVPMSNTSSWPACKKKENTIDGFFCLLPKSFELQIATYVKPFIS